MDQTLVDVTHIEGVKMGDKATILGVDGEVEYNAAYRSKRESTTFLHDLF